MMVNGKLLPNGRRNRRKSNNLLNIDRSNSSKLWRLLVYVTVILLK